MQYVSTRENPVDLVSRGSLLTKIPVIWWKVPSWLQVKENWPRQPDTTPSVEFEKEIKISKEHTTIIIATVGIQNDFDLILHNFDLHKAFRISAWILRFINNCRKNKKSGPLRTLDLVNQKKNFIKHEQKKLASSERFEDDRKRLNLKKNDEGVYICKGKLQGFYPVYLPRDSILTHSFPMYHFFTPWKYQKTRKVFWCVQGVEKGCIGTE